MCILFLAAMLLSLATCAGAPETKKEPAALSVGFGRVNITPEKNIFMTSYGNDITRLSPGVLEELFLTCVAITDNTGNTIMLITSDVLSADMQVQARGAVVKATGVPFETFDSTAMAIKDQTPYEMTFVITVSNSEMGYMPTQECWDYPGCYEVGSCYFERGTAEIMEKAYIEALNDLHG